jgi:hypothetical protein
VSLYLGKPSQTVIEKLLKKLVKVPIYFLLSIYDNKQERTGHITRWEKSQGAIAL